MGSKLIIFLFSFLFFVKAHASSCCGGGSAFPSLITGDNRAQASLVASNAAVTHSSNNSNQIVKRESGNREVSETLTLSGAYLVSTLWQVGGSLPYKFNHHEKDQKKESSSNWGDPRFQAAYEFLPEYSYSVWKPRGFIFLEQSLAFAKSTYDSQKPLRTDSMGRGFYTTTLGAVFVKTYSFADLFFMSEYHKGFKREFSEEGNRFQVDPGAGYSFLIGAGVSPFEQLRFGGTLLYSREESSTISGDINSVSDPRYFWEVGLSMSYLLNDYSMTLSYSDQTFLASASNSLLSKTLSFGVTRFFPL